MEETVGISRRFGVFRMSAREGLHILRRWPVVPVVILTTFVVAGIFAPLIAPHSPYEQNLEASRTPPAWYAKGSAKYLLGTDYVGRDVLSRLIHGARVSMLVMAISMGSGLLVGSTLGVIAGYCGGWSEEILMRLADVWWSLPFLLVALVAAVVLGQSFGLVLGILALSAWSAFVRNVRAEVLSLKTRDYVALAHVAGASHVRTMLRHIVPGVTNTIVVIATLQVGGLILAEASLSFLGVGIPAPRPAWGLMVAEGRDYLVDSWWIPFFPGLAIFLVVMSLNFLGDWLRDRLDPRLRQL
ncbi:MAG: ABC transporter permease [Chloroflexota bacterium]|nr:ABC transporter permease [Chloroflexota bacterium]